MYQLNVERELFQMAGRNDNDSDNDNDNDNEYELVKDCYYYYLIIVYQHVKYR